VLEKTELTLIFMLSKTEKVFTTFHLLPFIKCFLQSIIPLLTLESHFHKWI